MTASSKCRRSEVRRVRLQIIALLGLSVSACFGSLSLHAQPPAKQEPKVELAIGVLHRGELYAVERGYTIQHWYFDNGLLTHTKQDVLMELILWRVSLVNFPNDKPSARKYSCPAYAHPARTTRLRLRVEQEHFWAHAGQNPVDGICRVPLEELGILDYLTPEEFEELPQQKRLAIQFAKERRFTWIFDPHTLHSAIGLEAFSVNFARRV